MFAKTLTRIFGETRWKIPIMNFHCRASEAFIQESVHLGAFCVSSAQRADSFASYGGEADMVRDLLARPPLRDSVYPTTHNGVAVEVRRDVFDGSGDFAEHFFPYCATHGTGCGA